MIVKVQISLAGSGPGKQMLIYNKGNSWFYEGPATQAVLIAMGGEEKRFFEAERNPNGAIVLGAVAPGQDW